MSSKQCNEFYVDNDYPVDVKSNIPPELRNKNPYNVMPAHVPNGGLSDLQLSNSKVILWKGHCSVHTRFTVEQIENARNEFDANIIVHPECTTEVVDRSDYVGSTEFIVDTINNAPQGTTWAVGTEINLVKRLSINNKDKKIFCLDPVVCPCATMYRIHPAYLLWVLDGLRAGLLINHIKVSELVKRNAKKAIKRMLAL